jgi:predicted TPR repeat methyltransferase
MADLFEDKAADWDQRPVPQQISEGVFNALKAAVELGPQMTVLDFGAGTGLISGKLAPHVKHILAVDISQAMLEQLAKKPELEGKVEIFCQNILEEPLEREVDLVVSAMAMHHVEDTFGLLKAISGHLVAGGRVAIADLDKEDGDFHPAGVEGVYHSGFEREPLKALFEDAGFENVGFVTAGQVNKEGKDYPIFLVTATKPNNP